MIQPTGALYWFLAQTTDRPFGRISTLAPLPADLEGHRGGSHPSRVNTAAIRHHRQRLGANSRSRSHHLLADFPWFLQESRSGSVLPNSAAAKIPSRAGGN